MWGKILLGILVLVLIAIAGCGENNITTKAVQEPVKQVVQEPASTKPASCGNGECVPSERCDYNTYETVCPEDCPISCPPKIVVSEPVCVGECSTGVGGFIITDDSQIKIKLENVGEKSTDIAITKFRCYEGETLVVNHDGDDKYGIEFKDYFDNYNVEKKSINSRIAQSGNVVNYVLDFKVGEIIRNADLICKVSVDDGTTNLQVREILNVNLRKV